MRRDVVVLNNMLQADCGSMPLGKTALFQKKFRYEQTVKHGMQNHGQKYHIWLPVQDIYLNCYCCTGDSRQRITGLSKRCPNPTDQESLCANVTAPWRCAEVETQ